MNRRWIAAGGLGLIVFVLIAGWFFYGGRTAKKTATDNKDGREVLYWVAPMDPNYKSDKPGKSPMGMDLVPVYADEKGDTGPPLVKLTGRQLILADVETVPVRRSEVVKRIRTTGRVAFDERNVETVTAWFPGRIESLHVDFTGDTIQKGEPMAEIYSPELITAQEEFLSARGNPQLQRSARRKLEYWGITGSQLDRLERRSRPFETMTVQAPRSGTVIEKSVLEGEYVKEGTNLFKIADYDSLWLKVDVFQQNSPWIHTGQTIRVRSPEVPARTTAATVEYVDPFYDRQLRATQARATFRSPPDWVVPGKYLVANVEVPLTDANVDGLEPDTGGAVKAVPVEAVLRTGERSLVYVQHRPGQFEPRNIEIGPRARLRGTDNEVYPVVSGLETGEKVVRRGNFLIDSQSRIGGGSSGYSGALDEGDE